MSIPPVNSSGSNRPSYAHIASRSSSLSQLSAPQEASSSSLSQSDSIERLLHQPIENREAIRLAKRRKMLDTTGFAIFNAVKNCLKEYGNQPLSFDEYEEVSFTFREKYPDLFSWILNNGPLARTRVDLHSERRSAYMKKKVSQAMLWLPYAGLENDPVPLESIFASIRISLLKESYPAKIARELKEEPTICASLTAKSFDEIQESLNKFVSPENAYLNDCTKSTLEFVYLSALDQSPEHELIKLVESSESDFLDILNLDFWKKIVQSNESTFTWGSIDRFFDRYSPPLAPIERLLIEELIKLHSWAAAIESLQKVLSMNEPLVKSKLIFIAAKATEPNGSPCFPTCYNRFDTLFDELDTCANQFWTASALETIRGYHGEIQQLLYSVVSKEPPTELNRFFENYQQDIYNASLRMLDVLLKESKNNPSSRLVDAIKNSLIDQILDTDAEGQPREHLIEDKDALRQTLTDKILVKTNQTNTDLTDQILQEIMTIRSTKADQFRYNLCYEYFEIECTEWMQRLIQMLPYPHFINLQEKLKTDSKKWREVSIYDAIKNHFKESINFEAISDIIRNTSN